MTVEHGEKSVSTVGKSARENAEKVFGETSTPEMSLVSRGDAQGLQLSRMLDLIPEGGDDELAFLRGIFDAPTLDHVDAPWRKTDGLKEFFGRGIRVWSVKRVPSEFAEGLGWFFVMDIEDILKGTRHTVTTGSATVMAQIMKAFALGVTQFECAVIEASKPTRNGYYPYHLESLRPIPADVIG